MNNLEMEHLKRITDICIQRGERIAELEKDARLADMAWNDNQAALKAQAAEIEKLKASIAKAKNALEDGGYIAFKYSGTGIMYCFNELSAAVKG